MEKQRKNEDDLVSMSLGDHLDELRARLIMILLGVVVGMLVSVFFGAKLVTFLEAPYYRAMEKVHNTKAEEANKSEQPTHRKGQLVNIRISDHQARSLQNLQPGDNILAYIEFYDEDPNNQAFAQMNKRVADKHNDKSLNNTHTKGLQTIQPAEGFLIYLKVCLVFGVIIVSPWVFWHIWAFVSAGLYAYEKRYVVVVAPISAALFITGAVFFMIVVAPLAMGFFMRFNQALRVESNWTIQSYMNMILMLILVFGVAFQMPIAVVFAERLGLVSIQTLAKGRKYVLLALFVIAAVATPPDVISQIALAVPLYILFEASLIICRIMHKNRQAKQLGA